MVRNYSRFFSVELEHEYFLNRKCPDLEIVPAPDCLLLFRRLNLHGRQIENQFLTVMNENEAHEPFMNVPPHTYYRADHGKTVFRFYLTLKNPFFLNYTNLPPHAGKIFYFSNLAHNPENNFLYLSTPAEEFATNKLYLPGTLVREARTGQVYEANKMHLSKKKAELNDPTLWAPKGLRYLPTPPAEFRAGNYYPAGEVIMKAENTWEAARPHTSTSEKQLDDPTFWINRGTGHLQYPTAADQIEYSTGNYTFTLAEPVKKVEITITSFNFQADAPAYDGPTGPPESRNFAQPVTQVPVNLSWLKPGKYQIKVNKETNLVYYDPQLSLGRALGVIEIFNCLPGNNAYALLTEAEKIKRVNYRILFPARRVLWKYIRKDARAQTITDTGPRGYAFALSGDDFISTVPIPLSEGVLKTLKLEFNTADFNYAPLPNPPVQRFGKCTRDDYDYFCSEMYLNY